MTGRRFSGEQIIGVLRGREDGAQTEEVRRRHGTPSAIFFQQHAAPGSRITSLEASGLARYTLYMRDYGAPVSQMSLFCQRRGRAMSATIPNERCDFVEDSLQSKGTGLEDVNLSVRRIPPTDRFLKSWSDHEGMA